MVIVTIRTLLALLPVLAAVGTTDRRPGMAPSILPVMSGDAPALVPGPIDPAGRHPSLILRAGAPDSRSGSTP